ncbi:MAG: signal peptidase I [Chitinophagaceae bacterium]|nr:MAG: signal peptidase I [Chitinophagaceae bacterium]
MLTNFLGLGFVIFVIIGMWKTMEKAGEPGWAAIVPFYNIYTLCKLAGVKNWWFVFIPFLNIYLYIVLAIAVAKSFGKDTGFGIGLLLLGFIFYPILGFGDARYIGPGGVPKASGDDFIQSMGVPS